MRLNHLRLKTFGQLRWRHNMDYLQVEGKTDLVRDVKSGAIINRNRNAYELAKRRAEEAQRHRDEIRGATREINSLKCEMHEIKDMLKTLLDRN